MKKKPDDSLVIDFNLNNLRKHKDNAVPGIEMDENSSPPAGMDPDEWES